MQGTRQVHQVDLLCLRHDFLILKEKLRPLWLLPLFTVLLSHEDPPELQAWRAAAAAAAAADQQQACEPDRQPAGLSPLVLQQGVL
jgi:hypothetical protein